MKLLPLVNNQTVRMFLLREAIKLQVLNRLIYMRVQTAIMIAEMVVAGMLMVSGCGGSTGWRFEIGVSPVKELSNTAGIKQEPTPKEKY